MDIFEGVTYLKEGGGKKPCILQRRRKIVAILKEEATRLANLKEGKNGWEYGGGDVLLCVNRLPPSPHQLFV